ncbi:hypothetical protein GCM10027566_27300 [Arachidicoccus ginsenosidivorans]|jgi:hypothetical protein|uniref:Uncharacterized protein n=1 Tax=Arachidicoccus ginsenosidivorans TaxID=496057 RepID=A0A5B8VQS1_9BACT|nr:hypothetical protein [Arachidicoccus ginsenosidivorans]QEC73603.1 hypothetical protein FSB73_19980 [Arachidicoccus ginsenosidivorans]
MLIAKMMTVSAILIGIVTVGANKKAEVDSVLNLGNSNLTEHYFQFTGSDGQENQPAAWEEITATQYNLQSCTGAVSGCKLMASDVTTDQNGHVHPTQVYTIVPDPAHPDILQPITGLGIDQVKNRVDQN